MKCAIGIDIGGTKVAIAIVDQAGNIKKQNIIPTDLGISPQQMIDAIDQMVRQQIRHSQVDKSNILGIGIGAPGPLDSKNGIITCPENLTGWINVPIQSMFETSFSLPTFLENDANAAALAEQWIGAAKDNSNFVYLTVSTGIGAGIINDGKLLKGLDGNAGDVGHTVIDPSFDKCLCGQSGCLETIASGSAIAKHGSRIMGETLTTQDVFNLYKNGHKKIAKHIDYVLHMLSVACVNIVNTFDSEMIVIGGGVSKVGHILFDPIRTYMRRYALTPRGRHTDIVPAQLGQSSGVIGAAALCFDR